MALIKLETKINAPAKVCFDLSRDIDMHLRSMHSSKEQAIAGTTSGLIGLNDSVTWQAKHFGLNFRMTIKITEMKSPDYFIDEMIKGPFGRLHHKHSFEQNDSFTLMIDEFRFASPLGGLGKVIDVLFMKRYMTELLTKRNILLKQEAEANDCHNAY